MFEGLQKKWKVGRWRLFLILVIFAGAGSLTGYAGRKLMSHTGIENGFAYILLYLLLITLLWPAFVIALSLPFGQFAFFRAYLLKIIQRMNGNRKDNHDMETGEAPGTGKSFLNPHPKRIVIFASGAGSNARKIIEYFRDTPVKLGLIAGNKPEAGVVGIAQSENIPFLHLEKERFFRGDAYLPELDPALTDLVVLAGFLWKVPQALIDAFPRRIINIHPALLPKFGGKGMYGTYVHEAVLQAGELQSGITIHYVDGHYDRGDIIFQTACPVLPGDTPDKLAHRIHELEHLYYPQIIDEILKGARSASE